MQYLASNLHLVNGMASTNVCPCIFNGDRIAVSAKIDIYVTSHYACPTAIFATSIEMYMYIRRFAKVGACHTNYRSTKETSETIEKAYNPIAPLQTRFTGSTTLFPRAFLCVASITSSVYILVVCHVYKFTF